MKTQRKWYVKS